MSIVSSRRAGAAAAALVLLPFAGCLSSAPPAPPVRWFDPLPAAAPAAAPDGGAAGAVTRASTQLTVRVSAPAWIGREFVVRTAPLEVAFDSEHRWLAEPRELVAAALQQGLGLTPSPDRAILVDVERFEIDLSAGIEAVVRLSLRVAGDAPVDLVEARAPAASREPAQLAEAMGDALARATVAVGAALSRANMLPASPPPR